MGRHLRHTPPARIVALSFVLLILLGNVWFVLAVIGWEIPSWFQVASRIGLCGALVGGFWLVVLAVRRWLYRAA
jgi:protein-S-isoprenylcysteine O-methyltransferase Ste14